MFKCQVCSYSTNRSYNLRRHEKFNHKDSEPIEHMSNVYFSHQPTNTVSSTNPNDIRLKENFKVFISGPSRCGKTVFVSNLLEKLMNLQRYHQLMLFMYTKFGNLNMMKCCL